LAAIRSLLVGACYDVATAESGDDAILELLNGQFELILCDEKDILSTVRRFQAIAPAVPVIVMARGPTDGHGSGGDYPGAALDIKLIEKPFRGSSLVTMVYDSLARRSVRLH
jgi:CheY-like chemotaxis protein